MRALALVLGLAGCPEPSTDRMVALALDDGTPFHIDKYEYPNREGQYPQRGVTFAEAERLCAEAGKRLCTAAEWRRACAGPGGANRYGYADHLVPNICRVEIDLPAGHTSLTNAGEDPVDRPQEGGVTASGSYWDCRTPEGVHDLVGNLEEWVLDDPAVGGAGLEGGAWYTRKAWADCTGRYSRAPDYRLDPTQPVASAGFRCCAGATPSAAAQAADARARLAEAARAASTADYAPDDEVALGGDRFMDRYEYPNRPGVHPLVGVTWTDARDRCARHGKRLCEAAEWERACGGEERSSRPYGDRYIPAACGVDLPAQGASGSWLACESPLGARDLVGGVWEWTGTSLPVDGLAPAAAGTPREVRGGSWFSDPARATCRPADGYPAVGEGEALPDLGFRCCRGPAPEAPTARWPTRARCPDGMVLANNACIDIFEHPNQTGAEPTGQIDWPAAQGACKAAGKRVCTEVEWVAACEGPAGRRWPTGDTFPVDACRVTTPDRGATPAEPRAADPAGRCVTPEGAHDLAGNVWEWVDDGAGNGVLRGGGWDLSAGFAQCRVRTTPPADLATKEIGVRCCATPEQ